VVVAFPKLEALHPSNFTIRADGVVRLNPQLARMVVRVCGECMKEEVPCLTQAGSS
jgi:hypothetical protein